MMATVPLQAQKVTVSREIGVRNNYAYDILPNIGDRIIFIMTREQNNNLKFMIVT